jgi:F0F1-type ATP synthase membrane subunit b/b'
LFIMVCFWVAYWLVDRNLIRPVNGVLEERRRRVEGAEAEWASKHQEYLSATERLERELEQAAREAARRREELRAAAEAERARRLEAARTEAQSKLEAALAELERAAAEAREVLRQEAGNLAKVMAGRVLGRDVAS